MDQLRDTLRSARRLVLAWALLAGLIAPSAAFGGDLDQQQPDGSAGSVAITSTQSLAQTFTAGRTGNLDRVDLGLRTQGTPTAPLTVELRNVVSGAPGTQVLATASVPVNDVPATLGFVHVGFPAPAGVTPGTQYAIVGYTASVSPNFYFWGEKGGATAYPDGSAFGIASSPPTGSWNPPNNWDQAFKTYVAPPATVTGQRAAALAKCKKKRSKRARRKCRKRAKKLPV